jgi:hypothetical protein
METLEISLSPMEFDLAMKAGLPEYGAIKLFVKDGATNNGKACVCINWLAKLPSGQTHLVQAVTTAKILVAAADALRAWEKRGDIKL